MSIKLSVTDGDKKIMGNLAIEAKVLSTLFKERQALIEQKAKEILETNSLNPKLYNMNFSSAKDIWEANLNPGIISLPNAPGAKQVRTN